MKKKRYFSRTVCFLLCAVFALLFLGERPPARDWLGLGLVAAGVVVLALRR